jgi:hypothetical protein
VGPSGAPTSESGSRDQRWFHGHPSLALLLITGCGLVLAAVAGELGARVLLRGWGPTVGGERTTYARYDELLGWSQRPGFQERFTRREFSVDVRINSQGLRDRDYPLARTSKRRVLVLGDSFGWGYGVELHERFDEALEQRNPGWEIVNASVSGYGTDQELLYLRERGVAYRPDVVLLLLYRNDFTNNLAAAQYYTNKPYFVMEGAGLELRNVPVPPPSVSQRVARWLGSTYLWGRVVQGGMGALDRAFADPSRGGQRPDHPLSARLVEEIHRTSVRAGARFALVSVPMASERREVLHRQAVESGFPYLPLDSAFEQSGGSLVFPENLHWTAEGHAVAADAIEDLLVALLPSGASPEPGGDGR